MLTRDHVSVVVTIFPCPSAHEWCMCLDFQWLNPAESTGSLVTSHYIILKFRFWLIKSLFFQIKLITVYKSHKFI
jgi:hypothetical protein